MAAASAVLALGLLWQGQGSFWLPGRALTTAGAVDGLFYFILWVSAFFFAAVASVMVLFVLRYRQRPGHRAVESPHHSLAPVLALSVIPLILVIVIFWLGFKTYLDLDTPPLNAYQITATAKQGNWFFTYPGGYVSTGELHVPAGQPVQLVLTSEDVTRGFYVPDFRLKKDVVPGRGAKLWFEVLDPGEHALLSPGYCGTGHSDMSGIVIVHRQAEFARWLDESASLLDTLSPVEAGERLYRQRGCMQCHSVDGTMNTGPTLMDLFGRDVPLREGGSVVADESYLRESMLDPPAKVAEGFQAVMPTYQGKLADNEIAALIAYIKSLSEAASIETKLAKPSVDDET